MGKDINALEKQCLICAKNDAKRKKSQEPRETVDIEAVPLCQWAMDLLGPLPESRRGHKHVLVVTDLFTNWVELYSTATQTARETVHCLMNLVLRCSVPACLLSDQERNFMSDLVQGLMKALHIKAV